VEHILELSMPESSASRSGMLFDVDEDDEASEVFLVCVLKGSKLEAALRSDPRSTDLIEGGQQIVSVNGEHEAPEIARKLRNCEKVVIVLRTSSHPHAANSEKSTLSIGEMSTKQESTRKTLSRTSACSSSGTMPCQTRGFSADGVRPILSRRSSKNSGESEHHVSFALEGCALEAQPSEASEAAASEEPLDMSVYCSNTTLHSCTSLKSGASVRMAL